MENSFSALAPRCTVKKKKGGSLTISSGKQSANATQLAALAAEFQFIVPSESGTCEWRSACRLRNVSRLGQPRLASVDFALVSAASI
jgi:hypothetical protein